MDGDIKSLLIELLRGMDVDQIDLLYDVLIDMHVL